MIGVHSSQLRVIVVIWILTNGHFAFILKPIDQTSSIRDRI